MKYRPEIDGLRAIAVAAVVLFHAKIFGITGGFVGVDVFFVISGYLITSLILKDLNEGRFSVVGFWERRVRRIMPAAIVLMAVVIVAGYWFLLPPDYERLGASVLAQVVFAANFLFWQEAGYFGPIAEQTPLLHTWSLAVEEQFYLLFPFTLVALTRLFTTARTALLVLALLMSLALSVWATQNWPDAAFYLAPTRAWELLSGALLALHARRLASLLGPPAARDLVALAGLAMIAFAIIAFDDSTPFPSYFAALPVAGTVLFIAANTDKRGRIGGFLANRVFVGVGLISYSLYLWHWPLLVFARNYLGDPSELEVIAVLVLSVVLAYGSYRWVETPFRKHNRLMTRRITFGAAALGVLIVSAIAYVPFANNGLPQRIPDAALAYLETPDTNYVCAEAASYTYSRGNNCIVGNTDFKPKILVWGDSHAGALIRALDDLAVSNDQSILVATHSLCPPIVGIRKVSRPNCDEFNSEVLNSIESGGITDVVLSANWIHYVESKSSTNLLGDAQGFARTAAESKRVFDRNFEDSVQRIINAGARVWIVNQVPSFDFLVSNRLAILEWKGGDPASLKLPLDDYYSATAFINGRFADIESSHTKVIDVTLALCDDENCRPQVSGQSLYSDATHLSYLGATMLMPLISNSLLTN